MAWRRCAPRWRGHLGRNVVHYGAQYAWFLALTLIPLTQVIAIEFTMPIWVTLLAVAFLGERMGVKTSPSCWACRRRVIVRPAPMRSTRAS